MITQGLHPTLPRAQYHADPCPAPSLSSTIAGVLIRQSPLHAHHLHPRLGKGQLETSDSQEVGTIVHSLLLGGADIEVIDAPDFRTKAARQARDAATAVGLLPMLKHKHDELAVAVKQIRKLLGVNFDKGICELPMVWQAPNGIWCRGLVDHLESTIITDLKTTKNAHPAACERSIVNYGYDIQMAGYIQGLETIQPHHAGKAQWRWLFFEPKPPWATCVVWPDGMMRTYGERRWARACDLWKKCLEEKSWPGYGQHSATVPAYALAKEELE